MLDFHPSRTTLNIIRDSSDVYDNSTKKYSTRTTSGKSSFKYETYSLANIFTITINGERYNIGTIDGAADTPVFGLTFNYSHDGNTEYLRLFATTPLHLTTTKFLMNTKKMKYLNAMKMQRQLPCFMARRLY
jgi:hypothetical protein